ncbi:hypothetical protein GH714_038948 [Hevea brasiliensis]|uniref:Carbohydrate kinase PfkB domain-containing protein n=1 Tax=Hevea brasiliensis TaxID=3981 RepID=A0A6A6MQ64_HEVBR|nr:hypothetical protein GH714_038948 [Hevea brasiliensis]
MSVLSVYSLYNGSIDEEMDFHIQFYVLYSKEELKMSSCIGASRNPSTRAKESFQVLQEESPPVVCFGEILIDVVPNAAAVSLAEAPGFKKAPGGAPANVAVGIARLGGHSAFICKASIFHYGSIGLINEPCKSAHLAAMDIAKNAGCILSYDPNLRLPLWPSAEAARNGIMSIWNQADIIEISEDEFEFLTEGDDPFDDNVVLEKFFHPNLKLLLVTEGSEGCR